MWRSVAFQWTRKCHLHSFALLTVLVSFSVVLTACSNTIARQKNLNTFQLPAGFTISKVASNELASNIYSLTIDANGAVVVAGPGYVRRLIDENGDGIFDRAQQISDVPKNGAMGLCFEGDTLYAVGDQGVLRMADPDGDGVLAKPEVMLGVKTGGEHDAHAIRKGPDGNWYLLCGNKVGPNSVQQTKATYIDQPHAGFLLRTSPDFSERTIVNHGFRNAYDFDFNSDGDPFTFDSDGERDISLPWYQPCRVYRLQPGDDAGWMSASHKLADDHPSMPTVIGRLGRGSPTGVVCYRHSQFPAEFHDSIFVLDWTNGKIICHKRDSATGAYSAGKIFAQPRGVNGFAVTDAEVGADGSLFVSVGGRGTEGAVYRIQSTSTKAGKSKPENAKQLPDAGERLQPPATLSLPLAEILKAEYDARLKLVSNPSKGRSEKWPAVFDGYFLPEAARDLSPENEKLLSELDARLSVAGEREFRQSVRLLAVFGKGSPEAQSRILAKITAESAPIEDIHYLLSLTRMSHAVSPFQKSQLVDALLAIPEKLKQRNAKIDRNWPVRMRELAGAMLREFQLKDILVRNDDLLLPDNLYLLEILGEWGKDFLRLRLVELIVDDKSFATAAHLGFLGDDRDNLYCDLIRLFREEQRFLDVVVRSLAADPIPEDRDCLLRGLKSPNRATWRLSANGLRKIPVPVNAAQLASDSLLVLECGMRLGSDRTDDRVRDSVLRLLANWHRDTKNQTIADWRSFLADKFPKEFSQTIDDSGTGLASRERLLKLDFTGGDQAKGKVVYEQLLCAKCHDGGNRLGPSLSGLANRFSDADILSSILAPDQQVPQRYRALKIQTVDGNLHLGSIVYQSVDGIVLTDRNANTIRIDAEDIEQRTLSSTSQMPSGLLDNATDEQVIDLMAYLKSLSEN